MRKTRKPRMRSPSRDWRERVHSAFRNWWIAQKGNRALPKIADEKKRKERFHANFKELSAASQALLEASREIKNPIGERITSAIFRPLDGEVWPGGVPSEGRPVTNEYAVNPEASSIFRTMVFMKHGITFRELILEIEINRDAHRKLLAVHKDYFRLLSGGVFFEDLKLKFKLDHFQIIVQGLDFGLDKLNPEELADCLDEICPCAQRHSVEYFKKLLARIRKVCAITR